MALSATLPPIVHHQIIKSIRLKNPISIRTSVARTNIRYIMAFIKQPNRGNLNRLIPNDLNEEIPVTLVYVDNVNLEIEITEQLRNRLSANRQNQRSLLIRMYSASLNQQAREVFIDDLRAFKTRIMVCTEACGLGVDLPNIVRVVQ